MTDDEIEKEMAYKAADNIIGIWQGKRGDGPICFADVRELLADVIEDFSRAAVDHANDFGMQVAMDTAKKLGFEMSEGGSVAH